MPGDDRRTRRTKRLLKDALVQLVLERGFDNVTVEDIAEYADISRATFYKYARDKQDLLDQIVAGLQDEVTRRLAPLELDATRGFTGKPVLELFRHALEERDAYRVILRGEGNGTALRAFIEGRVTAARNVFLARAENFNTTLRIDPEVLARAWVGEQVVVLSWWLEPDIPAMSAEEVTKSLLDLSRRGRYWGSGYDQSAPNSVTPELASPPASQADIG